MCGLLLIWLSIIWEKNLNTDQKSPALSTEQVQTRLEPLILPEGVWSGSVKHSLFFFQRHTSTDVACTLSFSCEIFPPSVKHFAYVPASAVLPGLSVCTLPAVFE